MSPARLPNPAMVRKRPWGDQQMVLRWAAPNWYTRSPGVRVRVKVRVRGYRDIRRVVGEVKVRMIVMLTVTMMTMTMIVISW